MGNSLSEGFARTTYTGVSGIHHMITPVNYDGSPVSGVEPTLTKKDLTTVSATTGMNDFLNEFAKFFNGSTNFGLVEFYKVDPDTEERTFIWGFNANLNGSHASPPVTWEMFTMSFKTIFGGSLKIVGMEASFSVNVYDTPPFTVGTPIADLAAYITSDDSIVIGRDNSYAFAPISFKTKTSDVLRKRQTAV